MGLTKSNRFSAIENKLAHYAKALAHPARIAILRHLLTQKNCFCGDIVKILPLSQSTVSQHLKELKLARLINREIEGAAICYCIDSKEWEKAKRSLTGLLNTPALENTCC